VITIDASVLVAAGTPDDPAGTDAAAFLAAALAAGLPAHQPTLTLVEVVAAIARRTGDPDLAMEAGRALLGIPALVLHALDVDMSAEAAALAGRLQLRGADAIYAATALRHEATLVTLDDELRTRSRPVVDAVSPADWLKRGSRC
jgi:predicted nucleic acid-binding protein